MAPPATGFRSSTLDSLTPNWDQFDALPAICYYQVASERGQELLVPLEWMLCPKCNSTDFVHGQRCPQCGHEEFSPASAEAGGVVGSKRRVVKFSNNLSFDFARHDSSATTLPPLFRPSGTIYGYDTAPAQLALWINGRLVDPGVGLAALDAVLKSAAAKPLGASVLAHYKDSARGAWALENLSLDERAWSIGNAVAHGLAADAADAVVPAIAGVTAADLQRIAKRYFQRFDVALVLPRQGPGG